MAKLVFTCFRSMKLFTILLLFNLIIPNLLLSQTNNLGLEIPEASIKNFRIGLQSDNYGLRMSCLYYAGKYQICEFNRDLLDVVQKSDDVELCQMAIWSLYQIGDDSCCKELQLFLKAHPSEKIRNSCEFLNKIKEYDRAVYSALKLSQNSNSILVE